MPKVRSWLRMFARYSLLVAAARADQCRAARAPHLRRRSSAPSAPARRACRSRCSARCTPRASSVSVRGQRRTGRAAPASARARASPDDAELVAAAAHLARRGALDQPQVLIQRAAQIRQARVVRRERRSNSRHGMRPARARGAASTVSAGRSRAAAAEPAPVRPRSELRQRLGDRHVDETADAACAAPSKFTQRLFSVRPASSRGVLRRRPLHQHALHAADHALADRARLRVELRLQARQALLLDLVRHIVGQRRRRRARARGCR